MSGLLRSLKKVPAFDYQKASLDDLERIGDQFCTEHGDPQNGEIPDGEFDRLYDHLAAVLQRYLEQSSRIAVETDSAVPALAELLPLPGVITEQEVTPDLLASVWPVIKETVQEALGEFDQFRQQ